MSKRTRKSLNSEQQVCAQLGAAGWTEIHHNLICQHAQLDIVARSPEGVLCILEVKTQSEKALAHLPWKQALRLSRAAEVLAQAEPVEIRLVFVREGRVELLPYDRV